MREACQKWSDNHPEVWKLFVKFTLNRIARGFKHYGAGAIFERIRWETDQARPDGTNRFKMGNNFRAFYARRFMRMYPQHDGFFRTRTQKSQTQPAINLPEIGPTDVLRAEDAYRAELS